MQAYKEAFHIRYNTFYYLYTHARCIHVYVTFNFMGWLNYRIHYWHASLSHSIPHHHGQYVKQSLQNTNIHMHNLLTDIG